MFFFNVIVNNNTGTLICGLYQVLNGTVSSVEPIGRLLSGIASKRGLPFVSGMTKKYKTMAKEPKAVKQKYGNGIQKLVP